MAEPDYVAIISLDDFSIRTENRDTDPKVLLILAELTQDGMRKNREIVAKAMAEAMIYGLSEPFSYEF